MNTSNFVVFDMETGSTNPNVCECLELAAKVYDARTLEPFPDGEFQSLLKPLHPELVEDGALRVNGLTREQLESAPNQKLVWQEFVKFVKRFNVGGTDYTAPIACGKNIRNFDLIIAERMNVLHGLKKEKTVLFNRIQQLELQDLLFLWFEDSVDLHSFKANNNRLSMDNIRPYFGMAKDGAHRAMTDVKQTAELLMWFLKLHRELKKKKVSGGTPLINFKGIMAAESEQDCEQKSEQGGEPCSSTP